MQCRWRRCRFNAALHCSKLVPSTLWHTSSQGCSLCMGNQAQVRKGSTAMSTSTRNFPNRLGLDTQVYLGSAELASVCAMLGKIPTKEEYMANIGVLDKNSADIYRYMNFDKIAEFSDVADTVKM